MTLEICVKFPHLQKPEEEKSSQIKTVPQGGYKPEGEQKCFSDIYFLSKEKCK